MKTFEEYKKRVKELKVVKTQGTYYLGVVENNVLIDAVDCEESFNKDDITRWFYDYNIDELYEEIKLVGKMGYTIRPLNAKEVRHVNQCLLLMEDSKKSALSFLENDHFKKEIENKEIENDK